MAVTGTPITVPTGLTTVAKVKSYLHITGSEDDTLIGNLIARMSDEMETFCNRKFLSQAFTEVYDGNGLTSLQLDNFPITRITRIAIGERNAMTLKNTASDASSATVEVLSNSLRIIVTGGASASDQSYDLTNASYDTIAEVVAAINSFGNGWTATVLSTYAAFVSVDLIDRFAAYALDSLVTLSIPAKSKTDYTVDAARGELYVSDGFAKGYQNVYVDYTAGYSTIPDDLEEICLEMVAEVYRESERDPTLRSEKLGDYTWVAQETKGALSKHQSRLARWRRIAL